MITLREPIFEWGQKVLATVDLVNDGSHPDHPPEALLVRADSPGEIVNVGHHAESNTPVYLVEFADGMVVGCLEEELALV